MRESPLFKEFEHYSRRYVDLDDLIRDARHLVLLLRPIFYAIREVKRITQWEDSRSSVISILVIINLSCIFLSSAFFALCAMTIVVTAAVMGHLHRKYNILSKVFPRPYVHSRDNGLNDGQETAEEFRLLLVVVDSFMSSCSRAISRFYAVLKWDDVHSSLICYSVVCLWILALSFLPLQYSVTLLIDFCLLKRPLLNNLNGWKQQHTRCPVVPASTGLIDSSPVQSDDANSQSSDNQLDPGFHTDSEGTETTDELSSGDEGEGVGPVDGLSIKSLPGVPSLEPFSTDSEALCGTANTTTAAAAATVSITAGVRSGSLGTISRSMGAVSGSESALTKIAAAGSESAVNGSQSSAVTRSGSAAVVGSRSAAVTGSRGAAAGSRSVVNGSGSTVSGSVSAGGGRVQGMVGKLMELKQRRQQQQQLMLAGGSSAAAVMDKCTNCSVVFSSILKRKHVCSNCGQYFCSRCCSYKVPRATFGATAPAAQTETVAVCRCCHDDLLGIKKNRNS